MLPWHSPTNGHLGIRPVTRELGRMLKKSASVVLSSLLRTVKRERETKVGLGSAALLGERRLSARQSWAGEKFSLFEHPVGRFPESSHQLDTSNEEVKWISHEQQIYCHKPFHPG